MIGILASTIMQGSSLIIIKKKNRDISPAALTLGGMCLGVPILCVLAFSLENVSEVHLDGQGIGSILYLSTFGTVVTFLTYYWLLKRVQAVYLSFVSLVTPALAVLLGAVVLGEKLEPNVFTGASAIFAGIVVANARDIIAAISGRKERIFSENSA
jgi:drug/metabolite transporter (DMT)-like permease